MPTSGSATITTAMPTAAHRRCRHTGQQPYQRDPAEPAPDQLERAAKGSDRSAWTRPSGVKQLGEHAQLEAQLTYYRGVVRAFESREDLDDPWRHLVKELGETVEAIASKS
jgi:hypothetical protein